MVRDRPVRSGSPHLTRTEVKPLSDLDVLVIGAGLAGLTAARRLVDAGRSVLVVDKGRGVGGRLATRRIGDGVFDHGAQFFTSAEPEFDTEVATWVDAGVAAQWFDTRLEPDGSLVTDGHPRWRGTNGMSGIAKHLAASLDVRTGCRLVSLAVDNGAWTAVDSDDGVIRAESIVVTAPVPQTLALFDAGAVGLDANDRRDLDAVDYHPCIAVLALLDGPSGLPTPGALRPAGEPLDWVADNQMKGISPVPALTVHAGTATSRALWDASDDVVVEQLLAAVPGLASGPIAGGVQVQRWLYARPVECRPEAARLLFGLPAAVLAGDAFGGARVPGAAASGNAAAALLL